MSERDDCSLSVREIARREFLIRWSRRAVCAVIVMAVCYGSYRIYIAGREKYLERQARAFFERHEYQSAALVARRLLQSYDHNVAAHRLIAQMAELANRPEAVLWWKRVAHLEPANPENNFALISAAVRFGQLDLARRVLDGMPSNARQSAKFHSLAGSVALAEKDAVAAEKEFAAAAQIEPEHRQAQLNLAIVRLAGSAEKAELARHELGELAKDPTVGRDALRALTMDALARHDRDSARTFGAKLTADNEPALSDQLLYVGATEGTDAAALDKAKSIATRSSAGAAELITWMNRHDLAQGARDWGSSLPQPIATRQPVPLALAESYSFLEDWQGLRTFIAGKNWGDFECYRLAIESHALHRLNNTDEVSIEAQTAWRSALKAAQGRADQLKMIAQLAEGWGYKPEAEEAFWMIANGNDNPRSALAALQRHYKAAQNTRGLFRVATRAVELNPDDFVAANNCASLGLLLNGDSTARRLATKLHSEHPDNPALTSTYAFALYTEGKTADALHVLQTLKDEYLHNPAIAAYYFVMLVDNGEMERAGSFLELAKSAPLLPEEQQLFAAAARKFADAKPAPRQVAKS